MEDFKAKLEKLVADAAECEMIANLSADKDIRETFRRLAEQYRKMADVVRQAMAPVARREADTVNAGFRILGAILAHAERSSLGRCSG